MSRENKERKRTKKKKKTYTHTHTYRHTGESNVDDTLLGREVFSRAR